MPQQVDSRPNFPLPLLGLRIRGNYWPISTLPFWQAPQGLVSGFLLPTLGIRESAELGLPVPIFKLDLAETILVRFHNPRLSLGGLAARKGLGGVFVEGVPYLLPHLQGGNLPDNKCWLQAAFRKFQVQNRV